MDMEIFLHSIMTDAKGSKSNIAAKFQNALNLQFIPPIGVFWDIENCQVPKGKSAIALVQNIRENFFTNHREAEFMCVCDINKESKTVIQELILSQVTVVHISATSKNAADDKIKQCMRRFVDTHGAPSTLLLISDDVNFASDLSDFRHRHNIRIILLHRGHAHQSLLTCAHEHYEFSSITGDLPVRSPIKPSDKRPNELIVSELPINKNVKLLKSQLKKISENCGGKVIHIKGSQATIRFANAEAAERAQRRMDKEVVYGSEISVNFRSKSDADFSDSPPRDVKGSTSSNEASASSSSSRDSSVSPPRGSDFKHKYNSFKAKRKFNFPPPPLLDKKNSPSLIQHELSEEFSFNKCTKSESMPMIHKTESTKDKMFQQNWNDSKVLPLSNSKCNDLSAFSPFQKGKDGMNAKYFQRNIGRVSPFLMQDCEKPGRNLMIPLNDANRRNQLRSENCSNIYPFYSNQSYPGVCSNISMGFTDLQRISDNVLYSSQWNGAAFHSDPSQLMQRNQMPCDSSSVELFVTNLDPTFEVNEMKKILLSVFREHIMVLHISMSIQPDGSAKATVKVPSLQDAQYAISRLHRRKIGHKRILISHVTSDKNPPFHVLKSEAVALLNDIPTKSLPLIKFRELYEKRYHRAMAVSDLYKMRDAVVIQGDSGSRTVCLSSEYRKTPSIPESEDSQDSNAVEKQYCERHFRISSSQGWAEQYSVCPLPLVYMSLKTLSTSVHTLLDTHQGSLPLISFCDCYEAEIGPLPVVGSFDTLLSREDSSCSNSDTSDHGTNRTNKGVPLEHLIACVTGVEIARSVICIKKVQWLEKKIDVLALQNVSPALAGQLTLFGREVMDLLKNQPHCLIQFNKFIPVYHHHFGRQCRVADYGFTKLIDLLDAIPHIVQVLGEGQHRQVTLTHRTQIKRFASELLRILKSRASKQITVAEFPEAYEQVIEKPFDITSYGVCEIDDMLDEVPENVIVTCNSGSEVIIMIPRRDQTAEEIERTKQFSEEVIELMKHTPNCSMSFSKFIPSYHHHFGKQCRVADYGFTKLIELFEAIPDILEVKGNGEDKILNLIEAEQHKILTDRIVSVLKAQPSGIIDVNQISSAYAQMHGHALRPADFGFPDLQELLRKMHSAVRVFEGYGWSYVSLVDHKFIHKLSFKLRRLLMEQCDGKLPVKDINKLYQNRFGQAVDLSPYFQDFTNVITVNEEYIQLMPLHLLARDIIILLQEHDSHVLLHGFKSIYFLRFGVTICPTSYGFPSMYALLESLSDYFSIKGRKQKRMVCLNDEISGFPLLLVNLKKTTGVLNSKKEKEKGTPIRPVSSQIFSYMGNETKEKSQNVTGLDVSSSISGSQMNSPTSAISVSKCSSSLSNQKKIDEIHKESSSSFQSSETKYYSCDFPSTSKLTILPPAHYVNPKVHSSVDVKVINSSNTSSVLPHHPTVVQRSSVIDNAMNTHSSSYSSVKQDKVAPDLHDKLTMNPDHNEMSSSKSFNENGSLKSKLRFQSHENLAHCSRPLDSKEKDFPSAKSTPTRITGQLSRRNRIAAHFSLPID